jgi:hypothetical protein
MYAVQGAATLEDILVCEYYILIVYILYIFIYDQRSGRNSNNNVTIKYAGNVEGFQGKGIVLLKQLNIQSQLIIQYA